MSDTQHEISPEASAAWCRTVYASINEGGTWGVPRSGLVFTKRDGGLVLTNVMPWMEGMPINAEQVAAQQEGDYRAIKEQFEAVGIPVEREAGDGD